MNWIVFLGILMLGIVFMIHKICVRMQQNEEIIDRYNECFKHIGKSLDLLTEAIARIEQKKEDKK